MEAEEAPTVPDLSLDFVSKLIGQKVSGFTIKPGTAPGDNYQSILYCLKCTVEGKNDEETVHAISKCFPSHPMRQQFLIKSNIFWNELQIYKEFIPTLKKFKEEMGSNMRLAFAPLISGEAINFGKGEENAKISSECAGKIFGPFDNYLMMVDLRNSYGFRMANRMIGLDVNEVSLVMCEHSKLHALSWAYKLKTGVQDLSKKFAYMEFTMGKEDKAMWINMMEGFVKNTHETLKSCDGINPAILEGILNFREIMEEVMKTVFGENDSETKTPLEDMLRIKMIKDDAMRKADEVPWRVVVHGDCWINNLLFRYDKNTKKAIELILIDLQLMREACPTLDLVYLVYTSTTAEFRRNHLDDMLKLYHSKFMSYCDELGVDYLPGYSLAALRRRFHASKLIGFMMGLMTLPIMLKDAKDVQDLEKIDVKGDITEMFELIIGSNDGNLVYETRLRGIAEEMYNEGII